MQAAFLARIASSTDIAKLATLSDPAAVGRVQWIVACHGRVVLRT